jgi:uncharacterized phiE125 gp8 family phage protein
MAFELDTAPTCEPVDLRVVAEQHCRVVDEAEFTYIRGLLKKARRYVEGVLDRQLITAVWRLHLDEFPRKGGILEIRKPPVQSVDAILYVDATGAQRTLAADQYQVDLVSEPARIAPASGATWPTTRPRTLNAVSIEFTAGFGDGPAAVPETLQHAIELLVAHWYEHREPIITGTIVNGVPFSVESLLTMENWGRYP